MDINEATSAAEQRLEAILDAYRLYCLDAEDGLEPVELLHVLERINRLQDPENKLRVLPEDRDQRKKSRV